MSREFEALSPRGVKSYFAGLRLVLALAGIRRLLVQIKTIWYLGVVDVVLGVDSLVAGLGALFARHGRLLFILEWEIANLKPYRTCPVHFFGHAGTNLGRAAGRAEGLGALFTARHGSLLFVLEWGSGVGFTVGTCKTVKASFWSWLSGKSL